MKFRTSIVLGIVISTFSSCGKEGPRGQPGESIVGPVGPRGNPGASAPDLTRCSINTIVANHANVSPGASAQRTTLVLQDNNGTKHCRFRIRNRDIGLMNVTATPSGCGSGSFNVILGVGQEMYVSLPYSGSGNCVISVAGGTATCSAATPSVDLNNCQ